MWAADLDDVDNTMLKLMKYQQDPGPWPGLPSSSPSVSGQGSARQCRTTLAGGQTGLESALSVSKTGALGWAAPARAQVE